MGWEIAPPMEGVEKMGYKSSGWKPTHNTPKVNNTVIQDYLVADKISIFNEVKEKSWPMRLNFKYYGHWATKS